MDHCVKICSFIVDGETFNIAYSKARRRIESINNLKTDNHIFSFNFEKMKKGIRVNVFVLFDYKKEEERICKICKEFHCSFFINEQYNCDRCTYKSYKKRLNEKSKYSKQYFANKIKNI